MAVGYIPKNITFVYGRADTANYKSEKPDLVVPAFVVDSDNEKTMKTAEEWARNHRPYNSPPVEPKKKQRENKPFTDPMIKRFEVRREGGRAWKTVVDQDFYVDLREDVLLHVIRNKGIRPGGILNGEFVFAMCGSQMKLIAVGSPLYDEMTESTKKRGLKNIPKSKIKPGHVYSNKKGETFLFLGDVVCCDVDIVVSHNRNQPTVVINTITPVTTKNGLWYEISRGEIKPLQHLRDGKTYGFSIQKSKTVCLDHGPITNPVSIQDIKREAENLLKQKQEPYTHGKVLQLATIVPYGEDITYDENLVAVGKTF